MSQFNEGHPETEIEVYVENVNVDEKDSKEPKKGWSVNAGRRTLRIMEKFNLMIYLDLN